MSKARKGRLMEGRFFMLTNADFAVLNETYRSSRKGMEAINAVISKIEDEDLALDLNRQAVRFLSFEDRAAEEIRKASQKPEDASALEKARSWTSWRAGTL